MAFTGDHTASQVGGVPRLRTERSPTGKRRRSGAKFLPATCPGDGFRMAKEFHCLRDVVHIAGMTDADLSATLQNVVDRLPAAWRHATICCARLTLWERVFQTDGFGESAWRQAAGIRSHGNRVGEIEVFYTQRKPGIDEGPFTSDERALLEAVAQRVGNLVEHSEFRQQLQNAREQVRIERAALRQANTAMRALLGHHEVEKREIAQSVATNVDLLLMPMLYALESEVAPAQREHVGMLKQGLQELTSPFADKLRKAFSRLSAVEVAICDMIRNGLASKEIARLRGVSPATISHQRERIRKKLGLVDTATNLTSFLQRFHPDQTASGHESPTPHTPSSRPSIPLDVYTNDVAANLSTPPHFPISPMPGCSAELRTPNSR